MHELMHTHTHVYKRESVACTCTRTCVHTHIYMHSCNWPLSCNFTHTHIQAQHQQQHTLMNMHVHTQSNTTWKIWHPFTVIQFVSSFETYLWYSSLHIPRSQSCLNLPALFRNDRFNAGKAKPEAAYVQKTGSTLNQAKPSPCNPSTRNRRETEDKDCMTEKFSGLRIKYAGLCVWTFGERCSGGGGVRGPDLWHWELQGTAWIIQGSQIKEASWALSASVGMEYKNF